MGRFTTWVMLGLLGPTAVALGACEKASESTEVPGDDTAALEDLEANPPAADPGAAAATPAPADKTKPLPKVRDRDPEEEKKKLALSHQRSAEAAKHLAAGRLVEAIDHSRQALRIHEQNVEAMLVMAEAYYRQKKFELVQAVTSSALAVDEKVRTGPETSRAHNLKGFAYAQMGQDNLATQAFRMAAEADEKNASAWNNLGTRYMQAGDIATAKQCFGYALELDPRFAKAHLNLGAALRADGKLQDAEKSLNAALKLRPSYPEAYFNLGVLYLDAEPYPGLETVPRLEKAIGYLTKYRELAIADGPEGPTSKKGPKVSPGPAAVSQARADDYIRVAKKGIEREQRRIERSKTRDAAPAEPKPEPPAAAEPADAGTQPGVAQQPGNAQQPGVAQQPGDAQRPGDAQQPGNTPPTPAKPTPAKPSAQTPSKPTAPVAKPGGPPVSKPGAAPPAPSTPSAPPSASPPSTPPSASPPPASPPPASPPPASPPTTKAPSAPAPSPPAAKPSAPAPQKPAPQKPTPQQPSPQKPGASTPTPPGPTSASLLAPPSPRTARDPAGNPRRRVDTHALACASPPSPPLALHRMQARA